jgi:hypothetical protein
MYLLSALGGGLWIIPTILFLGSAYSFYRAYIQWKSGSAGYTGPNETWQESDERVNFFSIGATIFGITLLLATIGSIIIMYSER